MTLRPTLTLLAAALLAAGCAKSPTDTAIANAQKLADAGQYLRALHDLADYEGAASMDRDAVAHGDLNRLSEAKQSIQRNCFDHNIADFDQKMRRADPLQKIGLPMQFNALCNLATFGETPLSQQQVARYNAVLTQPSDLHFVVKPLLGH